MLQEIAIFLICISVVLLFGIAKKCKYIKKRCYIMLLLCFASTILTIGVLILTSQKYTYYESLEEAQKHSGVGEPYLVIEGLESARIIGYEDTAFFDKTENGWKISTSYTTIAKSIKRVEGKTIYVAQYNFSNEYYITISGVENSDCIITDNRDSTFYMFEGKKDDLDDATYTYYAYINKLDTEYKITIDGKSVAILD